MASKKRKQEVLESPLDVQFYAEYPVPESSTQAKETAADYIAREYGEAIRSGNVARMLEGILVEIVKWRMDK